MAKSLSRKQQKLIDEILKGQTITQACKQTGIDRKTYYRWLEQEDFRQALKQNRELLYDNALSEMHQLFSDAVLKQKELLNSENQLISLRASNYIINNAVKIVEANDLKQRLKALEHQAIQDENLTRLEESYNATGTEKN